MKLKTSLLAGAALLTVLPARAFDGATPLVAVVDTLEDVPEAVRGYYVERDGKFALQVQGMKTQADVDAVLTLLNKEKGLHKTLQDRVKLLGDRRIEDIPAMLDRIPELEAHQTTGTDEERVNRLVEARINARLGPVQRDLDAARNQLTERDQQIEQFQAADRTRTVHDKVRDAATKAKLLPEAVDDAILLADRVFEVTEDGRVVTKDNVGVTPGIEPAAWLTDIQAKRPHWWGPSTGGGAGGQRGGGVDTTGNPFTHDNWNMTEQGKLVRSDPAKADQLAKLAGTTVGGPRPEPRK
jgi:hypothetical protein